jgi:uncharacterized protein YgbK (DUF1537 family)
MRKSKLWRDKAMLPTQERDRMCAPEHRDHLRQLAIIADDLTGAADAAIAFTGVASPVRVQLTDSDLPTSGVYAISTGTRDVAPAVAQRRLTALTTKLQESQVIFKKIDSVFRGNTFDEIAAISRIASAELVLIAPAYPALGRRVRHGHLEISDLTGTHVLPIVDRLAERGCPATLCAADSDPAALADSMRESLARGEKSILCDATTPLEMRAIVLAGRSLDVRILWIGSGGLAHAIASTYPLLNSVLKPDLHRGDTVFFIGSDHEVTRGQVNHLQQITRLALSPCSPAATTSNAGLVLTVHRGQTTEQDVRNAMGQLSPQDVGCLFMTGGDTALLVCQALGIRSLRLAHEFEPGVPLGFAEGGAFDGKPVLLKSGGFGTQDLLCRIFDTFRRKEEVLT